MGTMQIGARSLGAAIGLVALACLIGTARPAPADEAAVRKQLLALNEITGRAAQSAAVKKFLADKDNAKRMLELADKLGKGKDQPFNRNASYLLAITADNLKLTDIGARFYRLSMAQEKKLKSDRGVVQAYNGLVGMYFDHGRYADSEKVCREFLALKAEPDPDRDEDEPTEFELFRPMVQRRLVMTVARQGKHDRALEMARELVREHPKNWLFHILEGQVYREAEKYPEAIKTYLAVIETVKSDKRLEPAERQEYIDEYRYTLSGLYVDNDQVDKAAEQLKVLLDKEPNNPTYLNDLGFIWADKGLNLPEAEKLIRKAIDEDRKAQRKLKKGLKEGEEKDNAAYLDSLGWVLFKRGKAKEAREWLVKAVKDPEGQVTEIYDHLGDVHLALGEREAALGAWKQALGVVAPSSKRDQKRKVLIEAKVKRHGSRDVGKAP